MKLCLLHKLISSSGQIRHFHKIKVFLNPCTSFLSSTAQPLFFFFFFPQSFLLNSFVTVVVFKALHGKPLVHYLISASPLTWSSQGRALKCLSCISGGLEISRGKELTKEKQGTREIWRGGEREISVSTNTGSIVFFQYLNRACKMQGTIFPSIFFL